MHGGEIPLWCRKNQITQPSKINPTHQEKKKTTKQTTKQHLNHDFSYLLHWFLIYVVLKTIPGTKDAGAGREAPEPIRAVATAPLLLKNRWSKVDFSKFLPFFQPKTYPGEGFLIPACSKCAKAGIWSILSQQVIFCWWWPSRQRWDPAEAGAAGRACHAAAASIVIAINSGQGVI